MSSTSPNLELSSGFSGKYIVEICRKNGSIERPFSDEPLKNLILDSFFYSILQGNHSNSVTTYVQSLKIGGGVGSDTPAVRTDTDLVNVLETTHFSTYILNQVLGNNIVMTRDFYFPVITGGSPISYREGLVGSFGIGNCPDITLSRFVFPSDITLFPGDYLRIIYTLTITLSYLSTLCPINFPVSDTGIDLSGNLKFSGVANSFFSNKGITSSATEMSWDYLNGTDPLYRYRPVNSTTVTGNSWTANPTGTIFGINTHAYQTSAEQVNNAICFFDASHVPVAYGSKRTLPTLQGPTGTFIKSDYSATDDGASIISSYFFPAHSSIRSNIGGLYLHNCAYMENIGGFSTSSASAISLIFSNTQTIPALAPIYFAIKWIFSRG